MNIKEGVKFYLNKTLLTVEKIVNGYALCFWEYNGKNGKVVVKASGITEQQINKYYENNLD